AHRQAAGREVASGNGNAAGATRRAQSQLGPQRRRCPNRRATTSKAHSTKFKVLLSALAMAGLAPAASAGTPQGIWLIDGEAAVQIFDCEGMLCGRILWLQSPHDPEGDLQRHQKNPDARLRA